MQPRGVPPVLVSGVRGFIGQRILTQARLVGTPTQPVLRESLAVQLSEVRHIWPHDPVNLLVLSWPRLDRYAARSNTPSEPDSEWHQFTSWLAGLAAAAAAHDVTVWGAGSGVEALSEHGTGCLGEPYRTYVRRKAEARAILEQQRGLRANWLRFHFLFGPGEPAGRLIPAALTAGATGTALRLGGLERRRHWLHVDDAVNMVLDAIRDGASGGWDVAGPATVSFRELCDVVEDVAGRPLLLVEPDRVPADADCPLVPAERPLHSVDKNLGSREYLRDRLDRYRQYLAGTGALSGSELPT